MAISLVETFSCLRDPEGNGYVSICILLYSNLSISAVTKLSCQAELFWSSTNLVFTDMIVSFFAVCLLLELFALTHEVILCLR